MVCPVCEEIFNESGYKFIVHAFVTQQPVSVVVDEQGQEAPKVEERDAKEMKIEMIPHTEKG